MAKLNLSLEHADHLPAAAAALGLDWQAVLEWAATHGGVIFTVFEQLLNLRSENGFDWQGVLKLIEQHGPAVGQFILWVLYQVVPQTA